MDSRLFQQSYLVFFGFLWFQVVHAARALIQSCTLARLQKSAVMRVIVLISVESKLMKDTFI